MVFVKALPPPLLHIFTSPSSSSQGANFGLLPFCFPTPLASSPRAVALKALNTPLHACSLPTGLLEYKWKRRHWVGRNLQSAPESEEIGCFPEADWQVGGDYKGSP